jgi:histidyl-tRNA synthetase
VGARYAIVLGGDEVRSGRAKLKDLRTRSETPIALAELAARLRG